MASFIVLPTLTEVSSVLLLDEAYMHPFKFYNYLILRNIINSKSVQFIVSGHRNNTFLTLRDFRGRILANDLDFSEKIPRELLKVRRREHNKQEGYVHSGSVGSMIKEKGHARRMPYNRTALYKQVVFSLRRFNKKRKFFRYFSIKLKYLRFRRPKGFKRLNFMAKTIGNRLWPLFIKKFFINAKIILDDKVPFGGVRLKGVARKRRKRKLKLSLY